MTDKAFTVFVLEDNEWYNKLLVHNIQLNPELIVKSYTNGKDLMNAIHESPNLVTLDYRLPDTTGEKLLKEIKSANPNIEVVIISEQEDIETAVELLRLGAYDYFVKSDDIKDRLHNTINHLINNDGLKKEVESLRREVARKYQFDKSIIGESPALQKIGKLLEKAVNTSITVSLTGETGTGKEVIAKSIHYNSNRKSKPFVAVNMAAIPAELIESELFGHEKGAFTGANTRRIGKFEEANGGTLFLDEIGEMDINFQAKLLRALQEKEIVRVGSNSPVKIDSRIIVATNRDLQEEVKNGNFREDLYYRLIGLPIHLPPLRERGKDVLLLANYFIDNFCKSNKMSTKKLSSDAKKKLLSYDFPGNIRELKSIIELAVVLADNDDISDTDLNLNTSNPLPNLISKNMTLREYSREIIGIYMERFNKDTKKVADALDIGQTTVYRYLKD